MQLHGEDFSDISDLAGLMEDFRDVRQVEVLLVCVINHCIAPPGLRFLPLLYFERFPATKIQAQEPCRAELRSDARDANNTPDHLKEAKFNSVNLCFGPFFDVCAILGSPRGPKWFNLVEILEFGQYF